MNVDYILMAHGIGAKRKGKDNVPPPRVIGFNVSKSGENAYMTWTNPKDTDFVGVRIVKKLNSYPTSANDGETVYKGNGTSYTDSNVKKAEYVYYRAFSYDFDDNYNTENGQTGRILVKGYQNAPSTPTLKSVTYDTVTLNTQSGIEYSKDGSSWQDSGVFSNLKDGTSYTFYARKKGNDYYHTSPKSSGLTVKTKVAPYDDKIGAPGNRKLLKGNMQAGWFGEVPASDFITGDELARKVGITAGTSQYSNEPWLKFAYKGDVLLVSKKPIRHTISWDNINNANCVYGDKTIQINGKTYAVMLMRGNGEDVQPNPKTMISNYQGSCNHNSMWNKLMLPIHEKAPSNWAYPDNVKSPTEDWGVDYTDADLITYYSHGNGAYSWCQETVVNPSCRLVRGVLGVSPSYYDYSNRSDGSFGWRPCLKLVR